MVILVGLDEQVVPLPHDLLAIGPVRPRRRQDLCLHPRTLLAAAVTDFFNGGGGGGHNFSRSAGRGETWQAAATAAATETATAVQGAKTLGLSQQPHNS